MASPSNVRLFVDILDKYIFYFEKNNPVVADKYLTGLIALIREHGNNPNSLAGGDSYSEARAQFQLILQYISKKKEAEEFSTRFAPIVC